MDTWGRAILCRFADAVRKVTVGSSANRLGQRRARPVYELACDRIIPGRTNKNLGPARPQGGILGSS